jgi:hypothetical protein
MQSARVVPNSCRDWGQIGSFWGYSGPPVGGYSRHRKHPEMLQKTGGGEGIRTPGQLTPSPVFKTGSLDHSDTPPSTPFTSASYATWLSLTTRTVVVPLRKRGRAGSCVPSRGGRPSAPPAIVRRTRSRAAGAAAAVRPVARLSQSRRRAQWTRCAAEHRRRARRTRPLKAPRGTVHRVPWHTSGHR